MGKWINEISAFEISICIVNQTVPKKRVEIWIRKENEIEYHDVIDRIIMDNLGTVKIY